MCGLCGCSENLNEMHHHVHDLADEVSMHQHNGEKIVQIEQDILAKNNQFAELNKKYFFANNILALNIMSGPGAGKTTLLTKTISELKNQLSCAVIVGDQQTDYDAQQLASSGVQAIQVNTGKVCHLDAHMLGHAMDKLALSTNMTLFIENIGNLVCPAMFGLGEHYKIVILSVTEGDNKPVKYPEMFRFADLMIITKMDFLPYVDFDVKRCVEYATRIKPSLKVLTLSAKMSFGLESWYDWLLQKRAAN